ncbi:MAG TPA: phytanoyl-CoA dioxygenase family protein [Caulobacteraceae bacterium]|nr:phytanoyl-CoA dioxygenase family protein [Caulobacteraceae bacterium]
MTRGSTLRVHGETDVGWCAATPPNETSDDDGRPQVREAGFASADPRAPKRRVYDDPEVEALRERLRRDNGLKGLEILEPHEIERAVRLFRRDGFVVVRDLLTADQLAAFREASARVLQQILDIPGVGGRKYITETSRLPHRYSYGTASASRHLLHEAVWAAMVDLPTTTPLLQAICGADDYFVWGAGGDLCLPGAIEYQTLHSDMREAYELPPGRIEQSRRLGVRLPTDGTHLDEKTRQLIFERTPARVTINFLMSDLTWENGPIRHIPGTQCRAERPPSQAEEPEWMRLSTLVGAPAGAGVIRDIRAWHGATPNLSREIRAMPNIEYAASWVDEAAFAASMPHAIWETLSPHGRRIAARVKAAPGVWPAGAGAMHPLAAGRAAAKARAPA